MCFVSKRLASTSFRRQLLGKLLVQRYCGWSGNVRLSHLLRSFLFSCASMINSFMQVLPATANLAARPLQVLPPGELTALSQSRCPFWSFMMLAVSVFTHCLWQTDVVTKIQDTVTECLTLECKGNYSATWNNMKLLHWLLYLVQPWPPINGQCTNHRIRIAL